MSATVTHDEQVAADQAAMDEAREAANGNGQTTIPTPRQELSFETGQGGEPDFASVKISGALAVDRDLYKGQGFYVRVVTLHGELVTEALVARTNLAFPDKTDKDGITTTERVHTLKVEGGD